ncbi:MAG: hypothetical protein HKO90_00615 [Flavobacteriaceae bacterium]|nr:hypothetical protein [Flavobacteriaceae bacterium]
MKNAIYNFRLMSSMFWLMLIVCATAFAQEPEFDFNKQDADLILQNPDITLWHVKAMRPEAKILHIKAIDAQGNYYPVKAIQDSEQTALMDIKAFVDGKRLPVKLIVKQGDRYFPFKAITEEGELMDIKAITPKGEKLDVKGVSKSGNIVHIRAIGKDNAFFNVVSISPKGRINDVKGIKMTKGTVEVIINGNEIFAHVKSVTPTKQRKLSTPINY